VLSLSIAKWPDLLIGQLLVYNGDRNAPPDLSNLLPEETDWDPDTLLTHHMLILAFLGRIANSSNIQPEIFLKESVHIYNRGSTRKNAIFLKCLWTNSEYPNSLKSMSI
jgi:hypothetical protein